MVGGSKASGERTLIGVLASHDSPAKHRELVETMEYLRQNHSDVMEELHFVFTGGTFDRIVLGTGSCSTLPGTSSESFNPKRHVPRGLRNFLRTHSTRLPDRAHGGLVLLSNLVIHHQCELLWLFLSPDTPHWVNCQNMALLRLSDLCFAKKYLNGPSILRWAAKEAARDVGRNPEAVDPLVVELGTELNDVPRRPWPQAKRQANRYLEVKLEAPKRKPDWDKPKALTIALIAHDAVKERMIDFATQYERELQEFRRILTTGTTGEVIKKRCHDLRDKGKLRLCQSGPYGGDLEIAAEILSHRCQVVVFFVDPLHPHPHSEDIRVVFSVCMADAPDDQVLLLSNELQAREWFDSALRFR